MEPKNKQKSTGRSNGVRAGMGVEFRLAFADGNAFAEGWDGSKNTIPANAWKKGIIFRKVLHLL